MGNLDKISRHGIIKKIVYIDGKPVEVEQEITEPTDVIEIDTDKHYEREISIPEDTVEMIRHVSSQEEFRNIPMQLHKTDDERCKLPDERSPENVLSPISSIQTSSKNNITQDVIQQSENITMKSETIPEQHPNRQIQTVSQLPLKYAKSESEITQPSDSYTPSITDLKTTSSDIPSYQQEEDKFNTATTEVPVDTAVSVTVPVNLTETDISELDKSEISVTLVKIQKTESSESIPTVEDYKVSKGERNDVIIAEHTEDPPGKVPRSVDSEGTFEEIEGLPVIIDKKVSKKDQTTKEHEIEEENEDPEEEYKTKRGQKIIDEPDDEIQKL